MAPGHADELRSLRHVYLDAGRADEWFLDLGAQAFSRELDKLSVQHTLDLFDGRHGGIGWRYPRSVAELVRALRMSTVAVDRQTAFAGPTALAELVRTREADSARARRAVPAPDRSARPEPQRVPGDPGRAALAEADDLDGERLAGPLAGVPIAVKDDIPFAGQVATEGSRVCAG